MVTHLEVPFYHKTSLSLMDGRRRCRLEAGTCSLAVAHQWISVRGCTALTCSLAVTHLLLLDPGCNLLTWFLRCAYEVVNALCGRGLEQTHGHHLAIITAIVPNKYEPLANDRESFGPRS